MNDTDRSTEKERQTASACAPRTALFAGSFAPFTTGHQSIVDRGLKIFDRIVIGIGVNAQKCGWQPVAERRAAIERLYGHDSRVSVMEFDCLTTEAAKKCGAEFSPGIIPGYFKSLSATNQIYISEREKIYEKQQRRTKKLVLEQKVPVQ